jgi:hypothetical protein
VFCNLSDLQSESDVEQKLLWHVLTQPSPKGCAFAPAEVATKPSLRRLTIGKGATSKLYFPDYVVLLSGVPLMVVEAKAPTERTDVALTEARMYAGKLNECFPSGVNPCEWIVASNGAELVASRWDANETTFCISIEDISIASASYAAFVAALSRQTLVLKADAVRSRTVRPKSRRAVDSMGGVSVRNEEIGHNTFGSTLALDFRHVFNPTSSVHRAYVAKNAYVRSKRRDRYVEPIEKLIRDISLPAIGHITSLEDTGDPREILRVLGRGTSLEHQVMLLVGSVGSGKTTFVDHLLNVALTPDVLKLTNWLRVNLNVAPRENVQQWLVEQLIKELRESDPSIDFDDLQTLLRLYSSEVNQLRKGPLQLLDADSSAYKERLADKLIELQNDGMRTLTALSRYLCAERGKLMIVVLDNADKRTREEQLQTFQLARWLQSELRCLTILPLRDTTYDLSRNDPPLDTAQKDLVFRIEPPQFTSVLSTRVDLALKELKSRGEQQLEYSLPNGIRVSYPASDQGMYLASILRSLYEHDRFLRRLLTGLAGRNIRRALEIFLEFCQSGYIGDGEILKIRQFEGNYVLPFPVVASVLLRLHRRFYDGDASYVKNLFQADPSEPVDDHFVRLGILRFLEMRRSLKGPSGTAGYHPVSELLLSLARLGHAVPRIKEELRYLLEAGCMVAEHQDSKILAETDLVSLSPAGKVHLEMLGSIHYLAACAEDTWMADHQAVRRIAERIGNSRRAHMTSTNVVSNARALVEILAAEQANWPREADNFLQTESRDELHDWKQAVEAVEREEGELRERAQAGRLYIGNLPFDATPDELGSIFAKANIAVTDIHLPSGSDGGGRGFGFATVGTAELVDQAMRALTGVRLRGRVLNVRIAEQRSTGSRR